MHRSCGELISNEGTTLRGRKGYKEQACGLTPPSHFCDDCKIYVCSSHYENHMGHRTQTYSDLREAVEQPHERRSGKERRS